ncbi:MAG: AP2 domain-containing protein [Armatimonadota bacterium]|nr:AP2 domain-containing protein [Armatimonadota bacterium]
MKTTAAKTPATKMTKSKKKKSEVKANNYRGDNYSGYKGISRIDSPNRNTHGWYVRVTFMGDNHAKFFSDSVHGDRDKALYHAVRYRNRMERELGKPRTNRTVATTNARNRSGVLGVKRIDKGPGGAYEVTWSPRPNVVSRTSVSIAKWGEEEAFRRACEIRQQKERKMYGGLLRHNVPDKSGRR